MLFSTVVIAACIVLYASSVISVNFLRLEDSTGYNFIMLKQMTLDIAIQYFSSLRCVIVVADTFSANDEGTTANIIAGNIGSYYTYINRQAENDETAEKIMLKGLDEKCLGIIIQVSDPVRMISTITELSRRSIARANRRILFLPPDTPSAGTHAQYSLSVDDVLRMREMDFFPDLVMARYQTQERIELVTQQFTGETTYKEQVVLDIWTERFVLVL
jgi:hypothetical protein